MNRFKQVFPGRHALLAVVHVESARQACANAGIAREAGCDGVFLINHSITDRQLLEIHQLVHRELDGWWVGVNCLGLSPMEVVAAVPKEVAGIWVDNADIDERTSEQPMAERIQRARLESGWKGLYFGGVAFKYQRPVEDLAGAARLARGYMDVVTSSGPGTGKAAACEKIAALRSGLGDHPLAIASGITPENVGDYLGLADAFLVATGISKDFTHLDPARVRALVQRVRA